MKTVFGALVLWLVLGFLSWLLATAWDADMTQPLALGTLLTLPAVAVWLTARTATTLSERWAWRVAFWAVTIASWVALLVIAQGRAEAHASEGWHLMLAFRIAALVAVGLALQKRSRPTWRAIREVTAVAATFVFTGGAILWCYDARTRAVAAQAEARWTEIGLPMAELEKTFTVEQENAGSEVVRQVLREHVGSRFYKEGTSAAEREPAIVRSPEIEQIMKKAIDIQSTRLPLSDDFDLSAQPVAAIEPLGAALEADYRRILAVEPPAWACDPRDGWSMNAPNFLGIRKFSQLAAADALRRLAAGDQEGAARALAAGLHLREGLRQNPTLVSLMVDVSVDGLLSAEQVRLPAAQNGLQSITQDVISLRAEFLKRLQIEGWLCLRFADQYADPYTDRALNPPFNTRALLHWGSQIANRTWVHRQCAFAALTGAEHAAIQKSSATLALADFGESLHEAVYRAHPSMIDMNVDRAAKRIHATLLLREQTELIRDARARLAAGHPVEAHDSVVLPGLRWELTADAEKSTVTTRLTGAPEWIVTNEVTGHDFWLLPLDGSAAWQFHQPARTTSRD